jgi:hypothetical protein
VRDPAQVGGGPHATPVGFRQPFPDFLGGRRQGHGLQAQEDRGQGLANAVVQLTGDALPFLLLCQELLPEKEGADLGQPIPVDQRPQGLEFGVEPMRGA